MNSSLCRCLIAYDGSSFSGWQIQPRATTVQGTLEQALSIPLRKKTSLIGSSRTDAGVHAYGQVAHFLISEEIDLWKLMASLKGLLPPSIRVLAISRDHPKFHSQLSAKRKCYRYRIQIGSLADPLRRHVTLHHRTTLSLDLLQEAASHFVGTHDFAAFTNASAGKELQHTIRTIENFSVRLYGDEIWIDVIGNGFLYKMVRNMVGCIVATAQGKLSSKALPSLLRKRDRKLLPSPAEPQGLCLQWIDYGTPLAWEHGAPYELPFASL